MKIALSKLNQAQLLEQTQSLINEDRRITLQLLDHLREIERRMLFAELGFGSLFEFCVKHLGLSEGSAQRRISAMRLSRDLPEAKTALSNGSLSLSNAAKLQSAFRTQKGRREALKPSEKKEILTQMTGLTQRQCEAKLFELMPETAVQLSRERERIVGPDSIELKLVMTHALQQKLERLKGLLAHRCPDGSYLQLLEYLADEEIAKLEKKKGITGAPLKAVSPLEAVSRFTTAAAVRTEKHLSAIPAKSPGIPAAVKREVWRQAQGVCEFQGCSSRFQLEIDHVLPKALGGGNSLENLRLLCRTHNVQQAHRLLGQDLMKKYGASLAGG